MVFLFIYVTVKFDHLQSSIPLDLLFYRMFKYINDSLLFISFITFRHSINDMKMEICILFAPNKNKRSCCSFNPTLFMAGQLQMIEFYNRPFDVVLSFTVKILLFTECQFSWTSYFIKTTKYNVQRNKKFSYYYFVPIMKSRI
jgi:hypothetical protein